MESAHYEVTAFGSMETVNRRLVIGSDLGDRASICCLV